MDQQPDNEFDLSHEAWVAAFGELEPQEQKRLNKLSLPEKLQWIEDQSRRLREFQIQAKKSKVERRDAVRQRSPQAEAQRPEGKPEKP